MHNLSRTLNHYEDENNDFSCCYEELNNIECIRCARIFCGTCDDIGHCSICINDEQGSRGICSDCEDTSFCNGCYEAYCSTCHQEDLIEVENNHYCEDCYYDFFESPIVNFTIYTYIDLREISPCA